MTFAEQLLARGFSMTTGPQWTGLMIAPQAQIANCPPGWIFLAQETATVAQIEAALATLHAGRSDWPKKPTGKKRLSDDELLDEVFSSQDYIGS